MARLVVDDVGRGSCLRHGFVQVEGQVAVSLLGNGDELQSPRLSRFGEPCISDAHSCYQEAVTRGNCYYGNMTGFIGMGTALTGDVATIALHNPFGSGVYCSLLSVYGCTSTISGFAGAVQIVLAGMYVQNQLAPSTTATIVAANCLLNGSPGKGVLFVNGHWGATPLFLSTLMFYQARTDTGTVRAPNIDLGGRVILPPNTAVTIQGVGQNVNGTFGLVWEEVPIPIEAVR